MCYMVVAGLPSKSAPEALDSLPGGVRAEPISNYGGLAPHMPDCSIYLITEGACSCSLYRPFVPLSKSRRKRLTQEFQRQGLTEEEIETRLKKMDTPTQSHYGFRSDVRHWICGVADKEGKAYVYIHWAANKIPRRPPQIEVSASVLREDPSFMEEGELCLVTKD